MDAAAVPGIAAGRYPYRFVIHDRDRLFAQEVDQGLANLGVRVLPTPVRAPKANSVCERLGGSLRRECLDFLIPFNQRHLQMILREWRSTTTKDTVRKQCAMARKIDESDMNAQDRTLQNVPHSRFR